MLPADSFRKNYYRSWKSFWNDLRSLLSNRTRIKRAFRSDLVDQAFQERLMLAVTEVNQCRYCRTFHVQQARLAGLTAEEIKGFVGGELPEDLPAEQLQAVLYARAWAETDGQGEQVLDQKMIQTYGQTGFDDILILLRMIRMGNLLGNTWDHFLYRISFGRWGS